MKKDIVKVFFTVISATLIGFFILTLGSMVGLLSLPNFSSESVSPYQSDLSDLDVFLGDISSFGRDEEFFLEMDQAYDEISDFSESALDEDSISSEAAEADFLTDLNSTAEDEAVLNEADQVLNEVSQ